MKRCPQCHRTYVDDTLSFCLDDGVTLVAASHRIDPPPTQVLPSTPQVERKSLPAYVYLIGTFLAVALLLVLIVGVGFLVWFKSGKTSGGGSGSPSPSPYTRRSPTPSPSPTTDSFDNYLAKLLWGTWTWNSFVVTYAPDGTGTYKNSSELCFNFRYTVKDAVLHIVALGDTKCGPSGLDYKISIDGDDLRQEYTGNGYVTNWKRVR